MDVRTVFSVLMAALVTGACDAPAATIAGPEVATPRPAAVAAGKIAASGTLAQTAITGLEVRAAGSNTIIEQTSVGTVDGTLSGTYQDEVRVIIHSNGTFNAHFTITCQCQMNGDAGVLELVAGDRGRITGPNTATFAGRATIIDGSGELAGLRGVLRIAGSVDLASGLSIYSYSGDLH